MRGRRLVTSTGEDLGPERALAAAVLLQAVKDALAGDRKADEWLAVEGALLADLVFDIHPESTARWRETVGTAARLIVARKDPMHKERLPRDWASRKARQAARLRMASESLSTAGSRIE